jgi:hypothetical protein
MSNSASAAVESRTRCALPALKNLPLRAHAPLMPESPRQEDVLKYAARFVHGAGSRRAPQFRLLFLVKGKDKCTAKIVSCRTVFR